MIKGFDFSHYQPGTIDFKAAKEAGFLFAIGKVLQGLTSPDPLWPERAKAALDAGLVLGAYDFPMPDDPAKDQADKFLSLIDGITCFQAGDFEWAGGEPERWSMLNQEQSSEFYQAIMDTIMLERRQKPLTYGCKAFLDQYLQMAPFGEYGGLWLADYTPDIPKGFENWLFWQETEKGTVPGVTGEVDIDVFNGTLDELMALIHSV